MTGPRVAVRELVRESQERLARAGVESARLDAEILVAHGLGWSRLELVTRRERAVAGDELERCRELVRRREERVPCAYLTGRREFYGIELEVDPAVLVPRPETETLVEVVLAGLRGGRLPSGPGMDLGTGSGAVAIAVATHWPGARILASDASLAALGVARRNVGRLGLGERIGLVAARSFNGVGGRFSWVASNPPYVAEGERASLMPEVGRHEPAEALFAGERGLDVLEEILDGAPERLLAGGLLAIECDPRQIGRLVELGSRWGEVGTARDLAGQERVVTVVRG